MQLGEDRQSGTEAVCWGLSLGAAGAAHLGLPRVVVGLDQNLAQADVLADGGQRLLHGLPGSQDGHASDLGWDRSPALWPHPLHSQHPC